MSRPSQQSAAFAGLLLGLTLLSFAGDVAAVERTGEQIYRDACARCHGPAGEGVAGKYDESLQGDRSVESLARLIERTMPEDEPRKCSADEAAKVAAYVHETFYSPAARARMRPATVDFARLTVRQYRNAVADLFGTFRTSPGGEATREGGGLKAEYYAARNFRGNKKVIDRVDPRVEFTFEGATPDPEKTPGDEFAIRWTGSVLADETGEYEFVIRTENGVRLWVNGDTEPLIDAWVSSAGAVREHRRTVFLLGGRAYPVRLETFRFRDKTASIALRWKPPHGTLRTIPPRHLSPAKAPETVVVTTAFPPDDGSFGYERGTSVSKAWDLAATHAAIETADKVVAQLDALAGATAGAPDRAAKVKAFCVALAERAFRRPLSAEERAFFAEAPFDGAKDLETAAKRAVLLVLKSPRFLYPELGGGGGGTAPGPYAVASRLAMGLWDSLPDRPLLEAAARDELRTREQVAAHARRMLKDPRAWSKVRDFLHHWLRTDEAEDLSKDPTTYPDFDDEVLADLRTSLDLFLESVVWGEGSDYRQLLLADYLLFNRRLAEFYGVTPPAGGDFGKVSFAPGQRSGVLTHPYLLSALAYHKNSSPIHRGVFLTRTIVGRALRPPPQAIQFMDGRFDPHLTMREKVTELTRSDACMSCHSVINPLGFSLEHYDAVGRFRATDNDKPVDAAGEYPAPDGRTVRLTGARDVAEYAAASPDAHRAFVRQLFNYLVKQPEAAYGPETAERLRASFARSDFDIRDLLVEIVTVSALHGTAQPPEDLP